MPNARAGNTRYELRTNPKYHPSIWGTCPRWGNSSKHIKPFYQRGELACSLLYSAGVIGRLADLAITGEQSDVGMAHTTDPKSNVISFDPHQAFATRPLWAHVIRSKEPGQIVCTAGQVGCDQNLVTPDNIDDEIALAFSNLQQCLSAAGATVKDILKLTYYIVDFDPDNRPHSKHLANFLAGHRPTTTLVPVTKLANPKWHFEVEAIASIPQARPRYVDVVIVGAGLSGLSAAREVSEAGLTYAIAEARDRVGGKTWSVSPTGDGRTVDLGAAWINDTTQAEVYRLAQSLGLKLVEQNTEGDVVMEDTNGDIGRFQYGSLPEVSGNTDLLVMCH